MSRFLSFLIISMCFFVGVAWAIEEIAYEDATVAMVDLKEGFVGILWSDPKTEEQHRVGLEIDLKNFYMVSALNVELEPDQIKVGDHVDVYCQKTKDGKILVSDITNFSQVPRD